MKQAGKQAMKQAGKQARRLAMRIPGRGVAHALQIALTGLVVLTSLLMTACSARVSLGATQPAATRTPTPRPAQIPPAPEATGKVILVSLSRQQLYAYQDGALAFTFTVETGR